MFGPHGSLHQEKGVPGIHCTRELSTTKPQLGIYIDHCLPQAMQPSG